MIKYNDQNGNEFISEEGICGNNNSFTFASKENYYEVDSQFSQVDNQIYCLPPSLLSLQHIYYCISFSLKDERLPWDEHTQNLILGGFFWFAWLAQFFGGVLAHKFGSKFTFGLSNFIGAVLSAAIPTLARIDARLVLAVRVIQGFIAVSIKIVGSIYLGYN